MYTSFQKILPTIFAISSQLRFIEGFSFWNVAEIGCRFFSAREEGCEKNVVKADEQERVTWETQERERDVNYIQNRMNCILDCTSFFSISSSSMYQIPIDFTFQFFKCVWEVRKLLREMQRMRSSECLGDHTLWILLDSCLVLIEEL